MERAQEAAGQFEGNGIRMMFAEVRDMLQFRYKDAPNRRVRHKLEWMRDYANRAVEEHGLPGEYKVTFPNQRFALLSRLFVPLARIGHDVRSFLWRHR